MANENSKLNLTFVVIDGERYYLNHLPEVVKETMGEVIARRPKRLPYFDGWSWYESEMKEILKETDLEPWVAALMLRFLISVDFDKDAELPEWILEHGEEAMKELEVSSPFTMERGAFSWYKRYLEEGVKKGYRSWKSFKWTIWIQESLEEGEDLFTYGECVQLISLRDNYGIQPRDMDDILRKNWMYLKDEVIASRVMGIRKDVVVHVKNKEKLRLYYLPAESWNKIDVNYWDGEVNVKSLLRAGLHPSDIYTELSKKEAVRWNRYMESINTEVYKGFWPCITATEEYKNYKFKDYPLVLEYPGTWMEVRRYASGKSLLVYEWSALHMDKLAKSKEVHGPAGETALFFYHQLPSIMTDDMLTNGAKTAFRKVLKSCEEEIKRRLDDQLKNDRPLPKLEPFPEGFPGVSQLDTTTKLRSEGNIMNHCVGSYIHACDQKRSYILHVEDGTAHGCTVEICPSEVGWVVQQVKGHSNVTSERGNTIAKNFVDALNSLK